MANSVKTLSVLTLGAVCSTLALTVPAPSVLAQITITSTVDQSGLTVPQTGGSYPLTTSNAPYDFSSQQDYVSLDFIDSISVAMTVGEGDTARGNFDRDNLTLGLDGYNTGIVLNGFPNEQTQTLPFSGSPTNSEDILVALQQDGQLVGSLIDSDSDSLAEDNIFFPAVPTTLTIRGDRDTAVPVPFGFSPGLGILALGAWGGIAQLKSKMQKLKTSGSAFSNH